MGTETFKTNELNNLPCATSCIFHKTCIENFNNGSCLLKLDEYIESVENSNNVTLLKGSVSENEVIFVNEDGNFKLTIKNGFSDLERKSDIDDK